LLYFRGMNLQQLFFDQIKEKIPVHLSLIEEISSLLNISDDSVYRRIRGDKELSFSEIQKLSNHFNISLDAIFSLESNQSVLFNDHKINQETFTFEQYLSGLLDQLSRLVELDDTKIIYSAKDFPLFHYFQFPLLASFKLFFWQKSILDFDQFKNRLFSKEIIFPEIALGKKVLSLYYQVPASEIWSEEIIHSTLRQIELYQESEFFEDPEVVSEILDEMEQMLNHLQNMAGEGNRYLYNQENEQGGYYQLYFNELILANNSLIVKSGDFTKVYLTYNELNYLSTTNKVFCTKFQDSINTLISKSALISSSSEKIRNVFFNKLYKKLNETRNKTSK